MCGIVGIVGNQPVSERLVEALKRLEYRGYDSAGVATIDAGTLKRRRAEGKLVNLESRLREEPLAGTIGIAHTRWATHGAPTERNAHPHFTEGVAVVHNGIIENFAELKDELAAGGAEFQTETDTEVVAHLLAKYRRDGLGRREAMHAMLKRVKGAYALAVLFEDDPSTIMAARNGPPLAIGHGSGEMFLGSDAIALAPFTNEITYLIDGDWSVIGKTGVHIFDFDGNVVERPRQISTAAAFLVD
ncbi:glutamine--fructose-6-phosphate aminotransferase, partial [Sinorhizobium meliloti]